MLDSILLHIVGIHIFPGYFLLFDPLSVRKRKNLTVHNCLSAIIISHWNYCLEKKKKKKYLDHKKHKSCCHGPLSEDNDLVWCRGFQNCCLIRLPLGLIFKTNEQFLVNFFWAVTTYLYVYWKFEKTLGNFKRVWNKEEIITYLCIYMYFMNITQYYTLNRWR